MNIKPPLIVIAGPTASGKSGLALALSRLVPSMIINADASQVYADLRIVSARPSADEEAQAPHRLFGYLDGADSCSTARWAEDAKLAIEEADDAGLLPVLVGGTGLYLRTLLNGMATVPEIDPQVRATVRALLTHEAHAQLLVSDPDAAQHLHPHDRTRILRALEVVTSTRRTLSSWQRINQGGIANERTIIGCVLLPPRDWLRARCDVRFDQMLACGGKEEVSQLLARRLDVTLPVMRAIGVAEIAAILAEPESADSYAEAAKAATRQYAKRQYTWFRNQTPDDWMRIELALDNDNMSNLVIKLHGMALTRSYINPKRSHLQN